MIVSEESGETESTESEDLDLGMEELDDTVEEETSEMELEEVESEMLKNFYKDSKRVNNKKMKKFFNYKLKFPTYVEGLNNIQNNLI